MFQFSILTNLVSNLIGNFILIKLCLSVIALHARYGNVLQHFLNFVCQDRSRWANSYITLMIFCLWGEGTNQCASIMSVFQVKMTLLWVPIASEKTEGTITKLCFLGLEFDSEEMVIRIPKCKINEITKKKRLIVSGKMYA